MKRLSVLFTIVTVLLLVVPAFAQDATPTPLPPEPIPDCPTFETEPTDIRVGYYMGQGSAYLATSQLIEAKIAFACVVEVIEPSYIAGWMGRAETYFHLREFVRAQYDYNTALDYDPNLKEAFNNRGVVFAAQYDFARAEADFQRAVDLDGNYLVAISNLAMIRAAQGDYSGALSVLEDAVATSGIDGVIAEYADPERPDNATPIPFDPLAARLYALLGIISEAQARDQFNAYLYLYNESQQFPDQRIADVAGALDSRFSFDLRLDDGSWLILDDFLS
jgi:Tfp pilus assembly protein PilF